jgi:hypothetical protein
VPAFVYTAFGLRAVLVKTGKQWLNHSLPDARKHGGNFHLHRRFTKIPSFYLYKVEIAFLFQEIGALK